MNFDLTDDQEMVRDTFARFLDEHSSTPAVRKAMGVGGFDGELWRGLGELGAFAMRVPEDAGGLGLGLFDAALLMEEAGRTLASGPLAEVLVAARLLGSIGGDAQADLLARVFAGEAVVTIALFDIAAQPTQWVAGGLVAEAAIARKGDEIVLVTIPESARPAEDNLASTPLAEIDLGSLDAAAIGSGDAALATFAAALEEWKLLIAAALAGLSRKSLELAAAYAGERKAFGQLIGTFQGISHPLADRLCDVDGARFLVWKAIRDLADGSDEGDADDQPSAVVGLRCRRDLDRAGAAHLRRLRPDHRIRHLPLQPARQSLAAGARRSAAAGRGSRPKALRGRASGAARSRRSADRLRPRRRGARGRRRNRRAVRTLRHARDARKVPLLVGGLRPRGAPQARRGEAAVSRAARRTQRPQHLALRQDRGDGRVRAERLQTPRPPAFPGWWR